jgi:hypothetical protein
MMIVLSGWPRSTVCPAPRASTFSATVFIISNRSNLCEFLVLTTTANFKGLPSSDSNPALITGPDIDFRLLMVAVHVEVIGTTRRTNLILSFLPFSVLFDYTHLKGHFAVFSI